MDNKSVKIGPTTSTDLCQSTAGWRPLHVLLYMSRGSIWLHFTLLSAGWWRGGTDAVAYKYGTTTDFFCTAPAAHYVELFSLMANVWTIIRLSLESALFMMFFFPHLYGPILYPAPLHPHFYTAHNSSTKLSPASRNMRIHVSNCTHARWCPPTSSSPLLVTVFIPSLNA